MKKLLSIIFVGLLLCTSSYSHDKERFIFLNCKGDFPSGLSSIYNDELIKIDLKKSKIIFEDGYEFIAKRKKGWDVQAWDFSSYSGFRTGGTLDTIDHIEWFNIDRFTGEGIFSYAKSKKSKWKLIKERFKVKCTKVDRAF
tara:strand:- start:116 stop:538 length:423 start_codon:yes stop_codon:yes gene_type:complete